MISQVFRYLLVASFILAGCTPAQEKEYTGRHLVELMKAAHGGDELDSHSGYHQTGTITIDGTIAYYEDWGDFHSLRWASIVRRSDGMEMVTGFDGSKKWKVGPDGTLFTDESPEVIRSARLSTYLSVQGYFHPDRFPAKFDYIGRKSDHGVSYDVLRVTPEGGESADLWLDVDDHRLQKFSGSDGGVTSKGDYSHYTSIDDVLVSLRSSQKIGKVTVVQRCETYEFTDTTPPQLSPTSHGK